MRDKDREKTRRQWREYHRSDKGVITKLLNYARDRAKKDGLDFDLDREFVKQKLDGGICEVSHLPYQNVSPGKYRTHPFAPSLDRVVAGGPYTKDNVRLVIFAVNRAMSDWGQSTLLIIAKAIAQKAATAS